VSSLSFLPQREEVPLSKFQNLLQVTDDDLAGHLDQERPELASGSRSASSAPSDLSFQAGGHV
jgi:hypothetical protein